MSSGVLMRAAASSLYRDGGRGSTEKESAVLAGPWGIFRVRPQRLKWKKEDGWQKSDEKRVWSTLVVEEGRPEERVYEERWGEEDLSLVVSSAAWLESILSGPSRQGFNLELPRTNKWVFNHTRQAVDLLYPFQTYTVSISYWSTSIFSTCLKLCLCHHRMSPKPRSLNPVSQGWR